MTFGPVLHLREIQPVRLLLLRCRFPDFVRSSEGELNWLSAWSGSLALEGKTTIWNLNPILSYWCSIQPVGSQIATGISLAGHTWSLWRGPNSNWQVLSFVSSSGDITTFSADLNEFFGKSWIFLSWERNLLSRLFCSDYLIQHQGVAPTQVSSRNSLE